MKRSLKYATYLSGSVLLSTLLPTLLATQVQAQAVERHLPSVPQNQAAPLAVPNAVPSDQDSTPIGPALRAIVVIGANDAIHATAADGVDLSADHRLKADAAARAQLSQYLGKPLSRQLIAEVEATIAKSYRAAGYPFVSLSTPEQEITSGVLQVRAIEFKVGQVTTRGTTAKIAGDVCLTSGDAINTTQLGNDLLWLNKYPFRQVQAMFTPGKTMGTTDLILNASESKPWQIYGGYSNTGSPATGLDRYYVGGAIGDLLGHDSVLSYQATGSSNALSGHAHPNYISQAINYVLPTDRHGQIEASADTVETNEMVSPFGVRLKATEGYIGYRHGVSDFYGDHGQTDVRIGLEAKRQRTMTLFGNIDVYDVSMNVYQLLLGYHHAEGTSDLDVALHLSPGNVDAGNSAAQVMLFSQGQMKDATYSYVGVNYDRLTPVAHNLDLRTQVISQFASRSLPRTEQAALGSVGLVRGYSLDDGAFDTALVVRNELRGATMAMSSTGNLAVSPYGFVDLGYGHDYAAKKSRNVASAGVGADVTLTRQVTLRLDAAYALTRGVATKSGAVKVESALGFRF